jgi:hypothetical protein
VSRLPEVRLGTPGPEKQEASNETTVQVCPTRIWSGVSRVAGRPRYSSVVLGPATSRRPTEEKVRVRSSRTRERLARALRRRAIRLARSSCVVIQIGCTSRTFSLRKDEFSVGRDSPASLSRSEGARPWGHGCIETASPKTGAHALLSCGPPARTLDSVARRSLCRIQRYFDFGWSNASHQSHAAGSNQYRRRTITH